MSCFTVTSASVKARSVSALLPHSQCQMWLSFLSFLSVRSTGAPGSSALCGSTTTGSGSESTSTWAAPSAAAERAGACPPGSLPRRGAGRVAGGERAGGRRRGDFLRLVHDLLDRQHHLGVRHERRHPVQVVL